MKISSEPAVSAVLIDFFSRNHKTDSFKDKFLTVLNAAVKEMEGTDYFIYSYHFWLIWFILCVLLGHLKGYTVYHFVCGNYLFFGHYNINTI